MTRLQLEVWASWALYDIPEESRSKGKQDGSVVNAQAAELARPSSVSRSTWVKERDNSSCMLCSNLYACSVAYIDMCVCTFLLTDEHTYTQCTHIVFLFKGIVGFEAAF